MNKAISDGLTLMPRPFEDGLKYWSTENGLSGQATYDKANYANLIAADTDFGTCFELRPPSGFEKLRYTKETPIRTGLYLRVRIRVKLISGPLPSLRIGGYAGAAGGAHLSSVQAYGPVVKISSYGEVVEVTAIVGSGGRHGVDMVWGREAVFGHFGLDISGGQGSTLRIENIEISDITSAYHRDMLDIVDVIDYGAIPDGITDCTKAFEAADADADGRTILVPDGTYFIQNSITMGSEIRFQGQLRMPDQALLLLTRNFDFPTYASAMGDEEVGLQKAIQALFNFTDHDTLDLRGRRIELKKPLDVRAATVNKTEFATARTIRNGNLNCVSSPDWEDEVATEEADYTADDPWKLTNVSNIHAIARGSLITGAGVGREVYVKEIDTKKNEIELSAKLFGPAQRQIYTFTRFKYALDFSGFDKLQRFRLDNIHFFGNGRASGVMLAREGIVFQINDCVFMKSKDRCITSSGTGCAGLQIDRCQFLSNEQDLPAINRKSIVFNTNSNDVKIRDNRAVRYLHFGVLLGAGAIISANHFFQGDGESAGYRTAGLVFTEGNLKSTIIGNYIDNCWIELTNEHDQNPAYTGGNSFGGVTISGNHFTSLGSNTAMHFLRIKPFGSDHFVKGITVADNVFKKSSGPNLDRVDYVDTSYATLDNNRFEDIIFAGNSFFGVTNTTANPAIAQFDITSASDTWQMNMGDRLPFKGRIRNFTDIAANGRLSDANGTAVYRFPNTGISGSGATTAVLYWGTRVKGKVNGSVRCDQISSG